jgi:hypothetical protein
MMAANQKQMDLLATRSVSTVSNTGQILDVASRLDKRNSGLDNRFDMLEQHLHQLVRI